MVSRTKLDVGGCEASEAMLFFMTRDEGDGDVRRTSIEGAVGGCSRELLIGAVLSGLVDKEEGRGVWERRRMLGRDAGTSGTDRGPISMSAGGTLCTIEGRRERVVEEVAADARKLELAGVLGLGTGA